MIESIRWNEQGLVPAIVQDADSGQVLMMAYMNRESLAQTLEIGQTVFWSRSRQELWHKGMTSGNTQDVVSIHADCDQDTLLVKVRPAGPACHTGAVSCFFNPLTADTHQFTQMDHVKESAMPGILKRVFDIIEDRKATPKPDSYTNHLLDAGEDEIVKKIGEEAVEVILAAKSQGDDRLAEELADLTYHCLVLLASKGMTPDDVAAELERRFNR